MVIEFDSVEFRRTLGLAKADLQRLADKIDDITANAMKQFAENLVGEAGARAPIKSGDLRASGFVDEPRIVGDGIIVAAGFNKVYAHIQDVGGIVRPVKAGALFIPLRAGVYPIKGKRARKAAGFKYGVDFILAKEAKLVGNQYWTGTLQQFIPEAATLIGRQVGLMIAREARRQGP